MSVDIATSPNFAEIDRKALGVDPGLQLAATYVREVEASIARVWENVFDWEHLPALHAEYFCDVRLLEEHARGWRLAVTRQPAGRTDASSSNSMPGAGRRATECVLSRATTPAPRSGRCSLPAMPIARLSRPGSIYRGMTHRSSPNS